MSISDDKLIEPPTTFKQLGEIAGPLLDGLKEQEATRLEREAEALEFEAEWKRGLAGMIRERAKA